MRRWFCLILVLILTGCSLFDSPDAENEPLPTLVDLTIYPTNVFLTQNAPDAGFGMVSWNPIDIHLPDHPGWVYTMSGEFTGVFDSSGETAAGSFTALVQSDELGQSRRVVLTVEGLAISTHDAQVQVEGVRINNTSYTVNNVGNSLEDCIIDTESALADLSASQMIGGVIDASVTGHQQDMLGVHVWQYTFSPENTLLPALRRDSQSVVDISADLWAAPSINAVVRYELLLNVQHVLVLWGEQPVSGTLHLLYELSVSGSGSNSEYFNSAWVLTMIELTHSGKNPLVIENPVMPASGIFGYDGSAYQHLIDFTKIGAIVTNPITWKARRVANGPRVVPVPSGALIHTGLPNPGMTRIIKQYGSRWAHSLAPIIVHVVATNPDEVARCGGVLDQCEGVAGIELGLHDQASHRDVQLLLRALTDNTQLPVLVRVPLHNAAFLGEAAEDSGAGGLVVAAPPRGTARDLESGQLVGGRVYGAWLKTLALRAVGQVAEVVKIPVIGSGGIHSADDARDFILAGAVAVQIDTLVWTYPRQMEIIARNLGGLELTRHAGALADEWQPGMGQTLWRKMNPAEDDDESGPMSPPTSLPE